MVRFGTNRTYTSLNHEHRNMWNFNQSKFGLTLVQKWGHRFIQKIKSKKLPHQECNISNSSQQILPKEGW
jgi:hypothetical protein